MRALVAIVLLASIVACVADTSANGRNAQRMKHTDYFTGSQVDLLSAAEAGDRDGARLAVEQGADVNTAGRDNMTPLFWMFLRRSPEGMQLLLELGSDPNRVVNTPKGFRNPNESMIEIAAKYENTEYLQVILENGGDPNAIVNEQWGVPVIQRAIMTRNFDAVKMLLEHGADINIQDKAGQSPLLNAVMATMYEIAWYLLRAGADPTLKDNQNVGPVDVIIRFGDRGIDLQTSDLAAYDEFVEELKRRELLKEDPPSFH